MNRPNALLKTAALGFAASLGFVCSCTASSQHQHGSSASPAAASATAEVKGKEGSIVSGKVTFKETAAGVAVVADFTGIPAGQSMRGFHVHEVGDCTPPDFTSAGSHFNPTGAPHGARSAAEHHAGDFGNIEVKADGSAHLELTSTSITVAPGPKSVVGRAVILHEKADDLLTQPTGNAGGRVACGVVRADS